MIALMASGGYPWTVIEFERSGEYTAVLGEASSRQNILPFAEFIASSMRREADRIKAGQRRANKSAARSRKQT